MFMHTELYVLYRYIHSPAAVSMHTSPKDTYSRYINIYRIMIDYSYIHIYTQLVQARYRYGGLRACTCTYACAHAHRYF